MNNETRIFTKADLLKMWQRPVEKQYAVAVSKMLEAIRDTDGDISISFSGGKDSTLLLDMYCELISNLGMNSIPIKVRFADTTNETRAMYSFIPWFLDYVSSKYHVSIDFRKVRPETTWAHFCMDNGIPLISKDQAKAIRTVKRDMLQIGCDYKTVANLANRQDMRSVDALKSIGFSDTSVLALTGYVTSRDAFSMRYLLSKKWMPMVCCPVDFTEQCCVNIKENPLKKLSGSFMTGEQASESRQRETQYLKTGCNVRFADGSYKSKPFGAMTSDAVLYSLQFRQTPICSDYGQIYSANGHYRCSGCQRTGCALCGFGCQYDTERFVRLEEAEPQKLRFAFRPQSEGGLGYRDAIEFMNEYCGTHVLLPNI